MASVSLWCSGKRRWPRELQPLASVGLW